MMSDLLREIGNHLPLRITDSEYAEGVLLLSGPDWRLRVSGAWRLVKGTIIEKSSGMEIDAEGMESVRALIGSSIEGVEYQSRLAPLDLVLVMSDQRILETFGEDYDDWLLTVSSIIVEGPMQAETE